ncbi:MAG: hypothetical protein JNM99_04485 [Verrucomicrobiaceae bacterium]|nr:hypothetical protein [Verrucomicrobiaceae bacterium]
MTHLTRLVALSIVVSSWTVSAQDDGQTPAVPLAQALKLGPEKLTKFTDESEAGMDAAAILYATAKRVATERALAEKDVNLVLQLDAWRDAIRDCRESAFSLGYITNGGGTMFSHGSARDQAEVEDFLGNFATKFPLKMGKGSPKAKKKIDEALAFIKTLKVFDSGDPASDKEAKANLDTEVKRVSQHWESLRFMCEELPAELAMEVATFATNALKLLKEEG